MFAIYPRYVCHHNTLCFATKHAYFTHYIYYVNFFSYICPRKSHIRDDPARPYGTRHKAHRQLALAVFPACNYRDGGLLDIQYRG